MTNDTIRKNLKRDIQGMKTIAGCKALQDQAAATSNADVIDLIVAADCTITAKKIIFT